MKNRVLYVIGAMTLMSLSISATSEACVTFTSENTYVIDQSGCVK